MKLRRPILALFRIAGCLAVVLDLVLLPPRAVQAHANLVGSDPETGAVLAQAPQTVMLEFSEALDPDFSKARLADADLAVLVEGPGRIDPNENRVLRLDLPVLPNGAYNVIWQARSAVDGHITSGVVTFSIGEAASNVSLLPPPGAPDPTTARPPLFDTLIRWLSYFAAAIMAGSLLFGWLVWRPAYRAWEAPDPKCDEIAARRLRQLALSGIASLAILSLGFLLLQAQEASQAVFQIPYSQALMALITPLSGWVFWLRMVLLVFLAYLASRLSNPSEDPATTWWVATILALAVLLTFSLQSHAAALDNLLVVAIDWLHITAMAAWLGGLLPLFLLLRQTELPAHLVVPKFSRLALASVAALAMSGLFSAFIQVRTFQALTSTTYGVALVVKSGLFVILIGLGAVNLLVLSPRLESPERNAARWLSRTVRTELVIGALVLVMAGLMTGVSPAFEALQSRERLGFIGEYEERGTRIALWVAPARVGENEIAVDVHGLPASQHEHHLQVLLRLQPMDSNLGITQVEANSGDDSRYVVKGSYLNIAGNWQVEAILRQPGADDIRHVFDIQVQPNPFATGLANPVPATDRSIASGKTLYEQNCLPCHGPQGKGDGPAGLALRPPPADLTVHTAPGVHPDGQLFEWITNGYPGSVMPAFGELLTEEQRWDLVNYIRTFGGK
jgi:copper transport protein